MSYLKRFGIFCAGFSAFSAVMYLLLQFLSYKPKDVESKREKLRMFFDATENNKDMRPYITLIVLLLLAVLAAHIFKRLNLAPTVFSSLALFQVVRMIDSAKFYDRPLMYVLLISASIIFFLGDSIKLDREDGGKYSYLTLCASNVLVAVMGVIIFLRGREIKGITGDEAEALSKFDKELLEGMESFDMKIFLFIAVAYIAITLVNEFFFRDAYFVGAILTFIPLCVIVYMWLAGKFIVHPAPMATLAAVAFAEHLILTLSPPDKVGTK